MQHGIDRVFAEQRVQPYRTFGRRQIQSNKLDIADGIRIPFAEVIDD